MTDLKRLELRGPVRTLRTDFAEWNPTIGDWSPMKIRTVVTFRPDGQVSEAEHYNPDGSIARQLRVFEDGGRLIEDQWWKNDVLMNRVLHMYDAHGRPSSSKSVDADGTERDTEICRYDDDGRQTKVVILPVTSSTSSIGFAVDGIDVAHGDPDGAII
jgi:hypothetical protein